MYFMSHFGDFQE